jgi:hypothetical protein
MFNLNYQKRNNVLLFKDLEKQLNIENCQNYIPLYNKLFQLNNTNYNNINLDNNKYIYRLNDSIGQYSYNSIVRDNSNNETNISVFLKLCPLIDPVKYVIGKYDISDVNLLGLPNFLNNNSHAKARDMNNSAYVDGFFSYLSSKLLKKYNFVHGLNYYGSVLGVKNNFVYNATDEIDLLTESNFFNENKNKLFTIDEKYDNLNNDSRRYKSKLNINNNNCDLSDFDIIELNNDIINEVNNYKTDDISVHTNQDQDIHIDFNENIEFDMILLENIKDFKEKQSSLSKRSKTTCSDCSSRSSNTTSNSDGNIDSNHFTDDESDCSDDNKDNISYETINTEMDENDDNSIATDLTGSTIDESIYVTINKLPISIICLEKCEDTLDSYMVNNNNNISTDEWSSILMQIIMILITYQKVFQFTHNDLHTNNIMYNTTNKKYLYYKYNNVYYKVPTYGKIYKIIDFGRAIYKYNNFLYCSDSFHKDGDASTQYNFEPYMNDKKPRLEPNYSFDLCRLACSLYDIICEDDTDSYSDESDNNSSCNVSDDKNDKICLLIEDWCKDDKGRNVIYKTNGEERYPDFKLYKMIVRTVHNHNPEFQLKRELFSQYLISKNKIKKQNLSDVMDIDNMSKE